MKLLDQNQLQITVADRYGVQHTEWFENEFNSTARKFDGKGNLEYTKLIN